MNRRKTLIAVVLAAVLILIVVAAAGWLSWWPSREIYQCLDFGGCWDAENNRCEMQDNSKCKPLP